jgi:hypothetical protein
MPTYIPQTKNNTASVPSSVYGNSPDGTQNVTLYNESLSFTNGTATTTLNVSELSFANNTLNVNDSKSSIYTDTNNILTMYNDNGIILSSNGDVTINTNLDMSGNNIDNVNIINGTTFLTLNGSDINLTATTGNITITPTNAISTTSVPYGLYVDSAKTKTYPTAASFQAYPLYRTTAELGPSQTYTPPSGINFIFGDSRAYTKSAGTTSDIESLYFTGFSQSFSWTDANTCKQYVGITDNFVYNGKDANSRISSSFNADSIILNCPSSSTQTITSAVTARSGLRINATNANATYNITNSTSPNLNISGNATNVIANISNYSFFQNSSFWDVSLNVAGGSLATITNMYGLRLHPPNGLTTTGLTITNNWGIYSGWILARNYFAGVVTIGTTTPNSSAILQTDSTTQGFLPPRMTGAQANAIATPAEGLMVYITNTTAPFLFKGWWGYNGATWTQIG